MRISITGATGFIGRSLCLRLARDGHSVVAFVRDVEAAREVLGAGPDLVPTNVEDADLREALGRCDAVINLAGAPVAKRWTARQRKAIVNSRVNLTNRIVTQMARASRVPETLISTSAVGFFGDRGPQVLTEETGPGEGFLAKTCIDWEREAQNARNLGARVVVLRLGVVLGPEGGALQKLLPIFKAGLGGRLGSGRQYMPWIHLDDVVELFVHALETKHLDGTLHATAPEPATNREFTTELGQALGRPTFLPVPAFALRLLMGRASQILLASQRAVPERTLASGYAFRFPTLRGALADLQDGRGVSIEPATDVPNTAYLNARKPTHRLRQDVLVNAPLAEVFAFFSEAENLGALTPPGMSFKILTPRPIEIEAGTVIDYKIKIGPLPLPWRTVIEVFEPGQRFVDSQHRGPYKSWYHVHEFEARGEQTLVRDTVYFAAPLGVLGRIAVKLQIAGMLRKIFGYRTHGMAKRFGIAASAHEPAPRADRRAA